MCLAGLLGFIKVKRYFIFSYVYQNKVAWFELVEDLEGMWSMQQGSGSFCVTSHALREINS